MGELRKIPNVGKTTEKALISMGYTTIESLKGKTADELYLEECLCAAVERNGFPGVSLSVQRENPALSLYLRQGFRTVIERGEEYVMAKFFDTARYGLR